MTNNPYLLDTYKQVWLKHFNNSKGDINFSFVNLLTFIKHNSLPVYKNTGTVNAKGMCYQLTNTNLKDCDDKVFIIYDVYDFVELNYNTKSNLQYYKIRQYPGYICNLRKFSSLKHYMQETLSSKSRYKFNSYKRKLEASRNIRYKMFLDDITPETYEFLFLCFKRLLKKRFFYKKTYNNNLKPDEWAFYKEVTFLMMLKKQAGLFVVYDNDQPIAITLLNFSDLKMIDVIRVFDIDYASYRLGPITIMKQLEWCFEHNFEELDFSKGYFEYKARWSNNPYWFEFHIYFDKTSLKAKTIAWLYKTFFEFKYYLRKKYLINLIHETLFVLHKKKYAED